MIARATVIAVVAAMSIASPATAQTLDEAFALARQNNPDLAAIAAAEDAADARLDQARSARLPEVRVEGQYSYANIDYGSGPFGFGEQDVEPRSARVAAEQLVFAGGRVTSSVRAAKSAYRSAEHATMDEEARLMAAVARVYLSVQVAQSAVDLRTANLTALREFHRQTAARFQSGEVPRSDVALAEARLAGAESDLSRALAAQAAARFAFERVVGVKPLSLSAALHAPTTPETLDEALAKARASSPLLAFRREAEDAALASVGVVRAQRFPTVSVGVEAASIRDEFLLGYEADSVAVVARARMPLFTGGRIGAEVREAKAKAQAASAARRSAELALDEEVASAFVRHRAAVDQLTAAERQAEAAKVALEDIRLEVNAGGRPTIDGLDAERDYLAARLQLDQAKAEVLTSAYDLNAAIGVAAAN